MTGIWQWLQQLEFGGIFDTLLVVAASLLCITVHELCHGLVAYWLGDTTAKDAGRLTLNPIAHVDITGLIMMAIVKFGWAKPVPINMNRFKNPKGGMAITALAGPVSNLILAYVAFVLRIFLLVFRLNGAEALSTVITFVEYVAVISTGLAVFNLIPISPLDGSKVLFAFLPQKAYYTLMRYERYGMIVMVLVLFSGVLDTPLLLARGYVMDGLQFLAQPFLELAMKFLL